MMFLLSTRVYAEGVDEAVRGVEGLSKTISDYGPLVVLLAVFLLIFILLVVLLLRSNANVTKRLINSQKTGDQLEAELLSKFVDGALKTLTSDQSSNNSKKAADENDYHKDLVGAYIDVNMAFKDASRDTLTTLNCNRVAIYMFHNGNVSLLGLPFFKMSCIHEWTNRGNNTLRGKSHSDMPLHLFNDFIEDLWKYGFYRSEDISKTIATDNSIGEFVSFSNTKSLYLVAIRNNDGAITGFVVAEFDNIDSFEHDEARNKEVKDVLDNMITKISPIVGNKYIFKKK